MFIFRGNESLKIVIVTPYCYKRYYVIRINICQTLFNNLKLFFDYFPLLLLFIFTSIQKKEEFLTLSSINNLLILQTIVIMTGIWNKL